VAHSHLNFLSFAPLLNAAPLKISLHFTISGELIRTQKSSSSYALA